MKLRQREVVAPCQIGVGEYGTQLDEILGLRLVVHEDVAVHILIDIAVRVAAQVGARIDVAQRAALAQNEADVTHASHVQVADRSDLAVLGSITSLPSFMILLRLTLAVKLLSHEKRFHVFL